MISLRPILENLNIKQVVSLDDDYSNTFENNLKAEEIKNYTDEVSLSEIESQYLYDSGFAIVSELQEDDNETSKSILEKIKNYIKETAAAKEDSTSPLVWLENAIEEISSDTLNYIKISILSDISTINQENTLWIIDREISGRDCIYDSISQIINKFIDNMNIFMVYSYSEDLCDINSSWDKRYSYLISIGFTEEIATKLSYQFYIFSKPKKPQIPAKIEFKRTVLNSVVGNTVYSVYCNIKEANKKVFLQFDELTKKISFDRLATFRYNVENEGEHNIYKLLNNIINLMELQQYSFYMKKDEHFVNAFKKIISNNGEKEVSEMQERYDTITLLNEEYLWNKYQIIDQDINMAYEDIQFGDVYELELTDFYKSKFKLKENHMIGVIVTQSCDCIIRKKQEITRKEAMIKLLIFEEQSNVETDNINEIYTNGIFLFKNASNTPYSFILNNAYKGLFYLDDAILDLSSLDINGQATLLDDKELMLDIELKKPKIWDRKMFENLKIDKFINEKIMCLEPDLQRYFIESKYGVQYDSDHRCFGVKRIGRLTYNNAHTILSHYINTISRVGKESPNTLKIQEG
jgi:hypothetical protein